MAAILTGFANNGFAADRKDTSLADSNGFGRRGLPSAVNVPGLKPPDSKPLSPLIKQVGGLALGAAVAFAIAGAGTYSMKQFGKSLDRNFVEKANPGDPKLAIERTGARDALLQQIHLSCTSQAATAELTDAQRRTADATTSLLSGEIQLNRAAAYVNCLTTEQPKRFCQKPQRQHLAEALRQYLKLFGQVREEWMLQGRAPAAALVGANVQPDQLAALGMPSARLDTRLAKNLAALETQGLFSSQEFTGLDAFGSARGKKAEAGRGTCG